MVEEGWRGGEEDVSDLRSIIGVIVGIMIDGIIIVGIIIVGIIIVAVAVAVAVAVVVVSGRQWLV